MKQKNCLTSRVMETETISKNEASSKSQTSRKIQTKKILALAFVLSFMFSVTACSQGNANSSAATTNKKLIGVWETQKNEKVFEDAFELDANGIYQAVQKSRIITSTVSLVFFDNGTYCVQETNRDRISEEGKYSITDNILMFASTCNNKVLYTFQVSENTLTLTEHNSEEKIIYTKAK
jgi:hypothetical protein